MPRLVDIPFPIGPGLILDVYAGRGSWWKGLDTTNVTFVDLRPCRPGIILIDPDIGRLPFPAHRFDLVCGDPPHLIRKSRVPANWKYGHFGMYPTRDRVHAEWRTMAKELHRVTKKGAWLIWKIIDGAKTAEQCVNRQDADVMCNYWQWMQEYRYPSPMPWSSAQTVFLFGRRKELA